MMELYDHQRKIVETVPNKYGIFMRPRTGKTPTSIRLACSRAKKCLVIIPKYIKEQWGDEIDRWRVGDCEFYIYTKERFRIDRIEKIVKKGKRQTLVFSDKIPVCDMVIVDECHRQASNYANKFFKTLDSYIKQCQVPYVYLLSGTPWNKNPWSVYSYLTLLGKKVEWFEWQRAFFTQIKFGMRSFYKPNEAKFPILVNYLDKMGVTVKLEDIRETQPDEEVLEYFDLNASQKKKIADVTDTNPAVRYIKINQIEQGTLKSTGYDEGWEEEVEKDARILELAEDNDKLIIVCKFLAQMEKYCFALEKSGYKVFRIHGAMKENLKELCEQANAMDKAVVIIQADKSDGYDLKGFSTMVFASMSYSFISYDQMKNRMKSMAKSEPCTYIHLLTRGKSVDAGVFKSVKAGQDFSDKLFKY